MSMVTLVTMVTMVTMVTHPPRFVVVPESEESQSGATFEGDSNRVLLALLERCEPHVKIITCSVYSVQ